MQPIFPDVNISPAYFKNAPKGALLVRTLFVTLQGEGPFAGQPAVFLRLGGCNLGAKTIGAHGCAFCDTDFRLQKSTWMTWPEIRERALTLMQPFAYPQKGWLLVITGGEPLLQPNLVGATELMLKDEWRVQIESNGMYFLELNANVTLVVSPKAGPKDYTVLSDQMLTRADYLKFLLTADSASPYHEVPDWGFDGMQPVYVSPMAVYNRPMTEQEGERASAWDGTLIDREATRENYSYAAAYALSHGLHLSMQMHLFAAIP